jgi:CheY-like chemotaxis protein
MTSNQAVILLVDDDEAKRYLMGTWLRRGGHTVIEAGTGREALEKAPADPHIGSYALMLNEPDWPAIFRRAIAAAPGHHPTCDTRCACPLRPRTETQPRLRSRTSQPWPV